MVNVAKRTLGAFVALLLAIFTALPGLRAQSAEYECCNDAVFDGYIALEIDPEAPSLPPNLYNHPFFRVTAKPNRRIGAQIPEYEHAITPRSGAHLATFAPTATGGSPTTYNLARDSGILYYDPAVGCFTDPIMFGGPDDVLMAPFARFDADPFIANAWGRLQAGTHTANDLSLLRHELFEARFEGIFRTSYRTAHDAALRAGRTWEWTP